MAQYVKKKFNLGLFIVLLICAFVPGIIYAIYCAIPVKITDKKPKTSGWLIVLISSAVNTLIWALQNISYATKDLDAPIYFILALICTALLVLCTLLNKDAKKQALLLVSYFLVLSALILNFIYFIYVPFRGAVVLLATLASVVGLFFMQKYHAYLVYAANATAAPEETAPEAPAQEADEA